MHAFLDTRGSNRHFFATVAQSCGGRQSTGVRQLPGVRQLASYTVQAVAGAMQGRTSRQLLGIVDDAVRQAAAVRQLPAVMQSAAVRHSVVSDTMTNSWLFVLCRPLRMPGKRVPPLTSSWTTPPRRRKTPERSVTHCSRRISC